MFNQISFSLDCISPDDFVEIYDVFSHSFIWHGKFCRCPSRLGFFVVLNLRRIGIPGIVDACQYHLDVCRHHSDYFEVSSER